MLLGPFLLLTFSIAAVTSEPRGESSRRVIPIKDASDLATRLTDAGDQLVVIFFMSNTSGSSVAMAPKVEELAGENHPFVIFLSVEFDTNGDIVQKYKVQENELPTFTLIRDSKKLKQFSGDNYDHLKCAIELDVIPPHDGICFYRSITKGCLTGNY